MVDALTPHEALLACLQVAGSQAQMARDLQVSPQAVCKWFQSSKRISPQYALKAEELYGVSACDLAPHFYPRETMVDRLQRDRIAGIDLRASSRFDRRLLGERFLQQEQDAA